MSEKTILRPPKNRGDPYAASDQRLRLKTSGKLFPLINFEEENFMLQNSCFVLVLGESGRGKSASLLNLSPETTRVINVKGKPLPFMNDFEEGKNHFTTDQPATILRRLKEFSKDETVTDVVIDDGQYIMASEFVRKANEKGYDKFTIMAKNLWDIMTMCSSLRPGLNVFMLTHEEETFSGKVKMKTIGKMTDEKLTPEGLSAIVLRSQVNHSEKNRRYFFSTQSDGNDPAKSPMGMFPDEIPNDLALVSKRIREYYVERVALEESKLFG